MNRLTKMLMFFSISLNIFAAPNVGKVVKARGDISALFPGTREAVTLKKGMSVKEDTSIVSGPKSFIKIQMIDGSKLLLGPKSKLIVNFVKKNQGGVISLLKGKIRSEVKKGASAKTKMLVRTRSAAMGVRGTDFNVSYNPNNEITSLVTYSGEVAMVKVKKTDKSMAKLLKNKKSGNLDSVFKKKTPVMVKKGSYSAVSQNLKQATAPVNLNPVQFSILKLNKNLITKKSEISEKEIQKEVKKIQKVLRKRAKTEKTNPNAAFNAKTGVYKPKEGGLIDLETGIYIPPSKESKFDKKLNIFVDKDIDKKIGDEGNFVPPKGIVLDAKKGFVVDSDNEEASAKLAELNDSIKGQVIKPKKPSLEELNSDNEAYDKYFNF